MTVAETAAFLVIIRTTVDFSDRLHYDLARRSRRRNIFYPIHVATAAV